MILITGGAGYIGSVTVELLRSRGERVVVLDNLERGHRSSVPVDVPFYEGNIGDRVLIDRIAREHDIKACIHFAALADVAESVKEPSRYFENNVVQGIAMLRALFEAKVMTVIFSSTCAVYGEPERIPISEDHPLQPNNPYGLSKLTMERIMESFGVGYGLKFVALRYFNACGATSERGELHEPETHLVPNVLRATRGEIPAVSVFGSDYPTPDGTCIRDYVHVADLADAHILALEYLRAGGKSEAINLGNGEGNSVLDVIETAREVTGKPITVTFEPRRAGDAARLVADAARARQILGWRPAFPDITSMIRSDWEWRERTSAIHPS